MLLPAALTCIARGQSWPLQMHHTGISSAVCHGIMTRQWLVLFAAQVKPSMRNMLLQLSSSSQLLVFVHLFPVAPT